MTLIALIIVVALVSFAIFLYKIKMKSKLSKSLGRPVEDHELTSLNSWMQAAPDKQDNYKKYVPAKSAAPAEPPLEADNQ